MKLSGESFKHNFESILFFGTSQANGSSYHFENFAPNDVESFCPQIMFVETRSMISIVVLIIWHNGLRACRKQLEAAFYQTVHNKDNCLVDFCKTKIRLP